MRFRKVEANNFSEYKSGWEKEKAHEELNQQSEKYLDSISFAPKS